MAASSIKADDNTNKANWIFRWRSGKELEPQIKKSDFTTRLVEVKHNKEGVIREVPLIEDVKVIKMYDERTAKQYQLVYIKLGTKQRCHQVIKLLPSFMTADDLWVEHRWDEYRGERFKVTAKDVYLGEHDGNHTLSKYVEEEHEKINKSPLYLMPFSAVPRGKKSSRGKKRALVEEEDEPNETEVIFSFVDCDMVA